MKEGTQKYLKRGWKGCHLKWLSINLKSKIEI